MLIRFRFSASRSVLTMTRKVCRKLFCPVPNFLTRFFLPVETVLVIPPQGVAQEKADDHDAVEALRLWPSSAPALVTARPVLR